MKILVLLSLISSTFSLYLQKVIRSIKMKTLIKLNLWKLNI